MPDDSPAGTRDAMRFHNCANCERELAAATERAEQAEARIEQLREAADAVIEWWDRQRPGPNVFRPTTLGDRINRLRALLVSEEAPAQEQT